ncbi:MAG: RNaseH domain-containing protein [Myxococcota bacterium]
MANQLRTSTFRLHGDLLGRANGYRLPRAFHEAWRQRNDEVTRGSDETQLPYASLATVLCALSGDFVRVEPWVKDRDPYFLISRAPVTPERIRSAVLAWEVAIWPEREPTLYELVRDVQHTPLDVSEFIAHRKGRVPIVSQKWVWEVAAWASARALAAAPLALDDDSGVRLYPDTEANLLTWDRLLGLANEPHAAAMHKITPRVISVPGVEHLVLHLDCSLTRFSRKWTGAEKHAWAWRGPDRLVLRSPVRRLGREQPRTMVWAGRDSEVMRQVEQLPEPAHVERPTGDSPIRATPPHLLSGYPLGTGPGQRFFELVASHARTAIPSLEPLTFTSARNKLRQFERPETIGCDALAEAIEERGLAIVVLYATSECKRRIAAALGVVLGLPEEPPDGQPVDLGTVRVVFERPREGAAALLQPADAAARQAAIEAVLGRWDRPDAQLAFLVQTPRERGSLRAEHDPKHQIRRLAARAGAVSQFIAHDPGDGVPENDFSAQNAVWDLFRSAGTLPMPVPAMEGDSSAIWVVGAAVVHQQGRDAADRLRRRGRGYVLSMVALKAGTRKALGYDPFRGKWEPLGRSTANFLAGDHNARDRDVATSIEDAIDQLLTRYPSDRAVVFLEAQGTRRLWYGLADPGEGSLPRFAGDPRTALVRVRAETGELPRPAGDGTWEEPRKNGMTNKLMKIAEVRVDHAFFYVDPPPVAAAKGGARTLQQTRFAAAKGPYPQVLGDNWQTASATEFWCKAPGPFQAEDLCVFGAELCRAAPTWTRTLRLPAPLHLARCVIEDHPDRYVARPDEDAADDAEAAK